MRTVTGKQPCPGRFAGALFASAFLAFLPAFAWSPDSPPGKIDTILLTWHDPARNRDVPVKIYYPAKAKPLAR